MFIFRNYIRFKGLVLLTLFFVEGSQAQDENNFIGCILPSANLISAVGVDSFVYYTPKPYHTSSYLVRWNFTTNSKDSIVFKIPAIEGSYNYRLTDFSSNGNVFIFCFSDYIFVYKLEGKNLKLESSKQIKKRTFEKALFSDNGIILISSNRTSQGRRKTISYHNLLLEELNSVKIISPELASTHLKPSNYFSTQCNNLLWLKPISQEINIFSNGENIDTLPLTKYFVSPSNDLINNLEKQIGLEGKMATIMSELDSLKFDYLEEVYQLNDTICIIYSEIGSGMNVKGPWNRYVAFINNDKVVSKYLLNYKDVDIMNLKAFQFNNQIYFIENSSGILLVHSIYEISSKKE